MGNKDLALAVAAKVNKEFGTDTVVWGSDMRVSRRFTSGSVSLDVSLGGGWPANQWVEIIGMESHGKGLQLDTTVPTPDGWTTIGALAPGDIVFGRDGLPTAVTLVSPVHRIDCYRVEFTDGTSVVTDAEHRWVVRAIGGKSYRGAEKVLTSRAMYLEGTRAERGWRFAVPITDAVQYPVVDLPLEPYTLGAWLGDGTSTNSNITSADPQVELEVSRHYLTKSLINVNRCPGFTVWHGDATRSIMADLRALGVLGDKHIPESYLLASVQQRVALLQGLMDTDGSVSKRQCEFTSTRRVLAEGVLELVRSLGYKARICEGRATLHGRDCGPKYRVLFYTSTAPFRLQRKIDAWTPSTTARHVSITSITPVESVPTVCIQVDNHSRTYLFGHEYRVTHNTFVTLKTIAANQALDPNFLTLWVAAEHYDVDQAQALGVDNERMIVLPTQAMEFAYQTMLDYAESRSVDCIVLDSYPALIPGEESNKDMDESVMAIGARLTGKFFRKAGAAGKRDLRNPDDAPMLGIIINQYRDAIGVFSPNGPAKTTPGGKAKNYGFYCRVEVRRDEWIQEARPGKGKVNVGQVIKVKTIKNKSAAPQQIATIDAYFSDAHNLGFRRGEYDTAKEVMTMAVLFDVITRAGAWYQFNNGEVGEDGKPKNRWQGKDAMLLAFRSEPDLLAAVTSLTMAAAADPTRVDRPSPEEVEKAEDSGSRKVTRRKKVE